MLGIVRTSATPYKRTMPDSVRLRIAAVCLLLLYGPVAAAQTPASALFDRLRSGDRAASLRLISQGADVNATEADGATPLHLAAEREDVDVVRPCSSAAPTSAPRTGMA